MLSRARSSAMTAWDGSVEVPLMGRAPLSDGGSALLELLKLGKVYVKQSATFEEITLMPGAKPFEEGEEDGES